MIYLIIVMQLKIKKQNPSKPTDTSHLDYISPWMHIDTQREIDAMLTKKKFIEELIHPLNRK